MRTDRRTFHALELKATVGAVDGRAEHAKPYAEGGVVGPWDVEGDLCPVEDERCAGKHSCAARAIAETLDHSLPQITHGRTDEWIVGRRDLGGGVFGVPRRTHVASVDPSGCIAVIELDLDPDLVEERAGTTGRSGLLTGAPRAKRSVPSARSFAPGSDARGAMLLSLVACAMPLTRSSSPSCADVTGSATAVHAAATSSTTPNAIRFATPPIGSLREGMEHT
ncbi:hypothetical protein BH23ACT10_BH23ACT10_05710 [soil metagenome]